MPQTLTSARQNPVRPLEGRASQGEQPLPCRTVGLGDEHTWSCTWHAWPQYVAHISPSHRKAVEARSVDKKESSKDKSSSLASDKNLDTTIKDLL